MRIIAVCLFISLWISLYTSFSAQRERTLRIEKKIDKIIFALDSSMLIPYDVWMVAINRTNAMWNGLVVSDSTTQMYFGDPSGKWINQYEVDSLLEEFKQHMAKQHPLRKYPPRKKEPANIKAHYNISNTHIID